MNIPFIFNGLTQAFCRSSTTSRHLSTPPGYLAVQTWDILPWQLCLPRTEGGERKLVGGGMNARNNGSQRIPHTGLRIMALYPQQVI